MTTNTNIDRHPAWIAEGIADRAVVEMDPYLRDTLEVGVRVADAHETHGDDPRSLEEYLRPPRHDARLGTWRGVMVG